MKNVTKLLSAAILMAAFGTAAHAQNAEIVGEAPGGTIVPPVDGVAIWPGPSGTVLFDNGPLVNSPGTGAGGADESVLQGGLGMNTIGFGHQVAADNSMIDDFTVPVGPSWTIDEMTFFAYQTGSSTTSTMTAVHMQIWNGDPTVMGSQVIYGDLVTNVMSDTAWSGIYRVTDTTSGATNRPIMAQTVPVGITLDPGTYWVEWQTDGSLASGPWAPPVTINGQITTGNALQNLAGTIAPANDTGTATQQGLPFIVTGIAGTVEVPTLSIWGLGLMGLLMLGVAVVVIRRS